MGKKIFPNLPTSFVPALIAYFGILLMLYFSFLGNFKTSPILIFMPSLLFVLIALPKDKWSNIRDALGLTIPGDRYWLAVVMLIAGGIGAYLFVSFMLSMGIPNAVYIVPLASGVSVPEGISYSVILNLVIAVLENVYVLITFKSLGNYINTKNWFSKTTTLLISFLIAVSMWSSLHIFSYTLSRGLGLGAYLQVISLGFLMFLLILPLDPLYAPKPGIQWKWYPIYYSISWHLTFNFLVSLHMASISLSLFGIPIVS